MCTAYPNIGNVGKLYTFRFIFQLFSLETSWGKEETFTWLKEKEISIYVQQQKYFYKCYIYQYCHIVLLEMFKGILYYKVYINSFNKDVYVLIHKECYNPYKWLTQLLLVYSLCIIRYINNIQALNIVVCHMFSLNFSIKLL